MGGQPSRAATVGFVKISHALAAGAVLALTACGGSPAPAATTDPVRVGGHLVLSHGDSVRESGTGEGGTPCQGTGGYGDIAAGAVVRVAADDGRTLALGALTGGFVVGDPVITYQCRFGWSVTVTDLGPGEFFVVEVGSRGEVRVTRDQLTGSLADLTLGSL